LYHLAPTRVILVEEVDGKWNFVGHALIEKLTIDALANQTSGSYRITRLFPAEYRVLANAYEAPEGKGLTIVGTTNRSGAPT